jgi:protein-L-isoaspartate(D-aspartate) O-methyltransferase
MVWKRVSFFYPILFLLFPLCLKGGETYEPLYNPIYGSGAKDDIVTETMRSVDRSKYCGNGPCSSDTPAPIGEGQTISAPHMHYYALKESLPYLKDAISSQAGKDPIKIADIGSGSGYLTVAYRVLADKLKAKNVKVIGIELFQSLVDFSKENFERDKENYKNYGDDGDKSVIFKRGDGYEMEGENEYNVIHVGAVAMHSYPPNLSKALKKGGILIIPIQDPDGNQYMNICTKDNDDETTCKKDIAVRYVPLVNEKTTKEEIINP